MFFCIIVIFWKVGDEIVWVDGYIIVEVVYEEVLNLIKGRDEIEFKVISRCVVYFYILIIFTVIVLECDIFIFFDIMKDNLNKKRIEFKK